METWLWYLAIRMETWVSRLETIIFINDSHEPFNEVIMIHVNLILTLNKYYEKTSYLQYANILWISHGNVY